MKIKKFLIFGNDKKMISCRNKLISFGYGAYINSGNDSLTQIDRYDYIILPIPTLSEGYINGTECILEDLLNAVNDTQYIFYGNSNELQRHKNCVSYYNNDFIKVNSDLTAQGVLRLVLDNVEFCLNGIKTAVIGYGNCGKKIAEVFQKQGMDVTVFLRMHNNQLPVFSEGLLSDDISVINDVLESYKIIVNTVPYNVIDDVGVIRLPSEGIYIEVASYPYGFDKSKLNLCKCKYIFANSLPGRYTPVSAGENIAEAIINILKGV